MDSFIRDLRYATRGLLKHPGFAIVAILTLALGIGVNSALFTVFNAFVLKPLPVRDPGSLVAFEGSDAEGHRRRLFSYLDYQDYRKQTNVLTDIVAWNKVSTTLGEAPPRTNDDSVLPEGYENIFGQIASDNYFSVLGADFQLGHGFTAHDDNEAVVVLSHGFWQRRFQGDHEIVGKSIRLAGVSYTIVGVTSPNFVGTTPDVPSFWAPLTMRDDLVKSWGFQSWRTDRKSDAFVLIGRLAPGVTRSQAQSSLQLTTTQLAQTYPAKKGKTTINLSAGGTFVTLDEDTLPLFTPLALGFGLILLMSCVNVASLLLARAAGRQREIGVRLALGAGRWRVIRQLITESVVIAVVGGVFGLITSIWTLRLAYRIALSVFPLPSDIASGFTIDLQPDWRIFGFTLLLASIAGVAAGLVPALQASKPSVIDAIREGSTLAGSYNKSRFRSLLVVTQMATCFALLVAAALLVQNSRKMQTADIGISTHNVFGVVVNFSNDRKTSTQVVTDFRDHVAARIRQIPGVTSVSYAHNRPLSGQMSNTVVSINDSNSNQSVETAYNSVSAEYFQTVSLPLLRGRTFTEDEVKSTAPVVVISEGAANRYWPGRDAIGRRIAITDKQQGLRQLEIIGVARETRNRWIWRKDDKFIYLPISPSEEISPYLLVKTQSDPNPIMAQTRNVISAMYPDAHSSVKSFADDIAFQTAPFRAVAAISGLLGLLALVLCAVGLYGVMSYMVASRTREVGIRMALGASPVNVVQMFTLDGFKLTATGMLLGLAGAGSIAQLLRAVLIDMSFLDPVVYGTVGLFLALVAFVAIIIPARRATKVDPMEALRYE